MASGYCWDGPLAEPEGECGLPTQSIGVELLPIGLPWKKVKENWDEIKFRETRSWFEISNKFKSIFKRKKFWAQD